MSEVGWSLYTVIAVVAYRGVRALLKQGNSTLALADYYCECPEAPDRIWNLVFMWNLLVLKCEPYLQAAFNLRASACFTFSLTCLNISCAFLRYLQVDFKLKFKIELINSLFPSSAFNCFFSFIPYFIKCYCHIHINWSEKPRSNPLTFLITS